MADRPLDFETFRRARKPSPRARSAHPFATPSDQPLDYVAAVAARRESQEELDNAAEAYRKALQKECAFDKIPHSGQLSLSFHLDPADATGKAACSITIRDSTRRLDNGASLIEGFLDCVIDAAGLAAFSEATGSRIQGFRSTGDTHDPDGSHVMVFTDEDFPRLRRVLNLGLGPRNRVDFQERITASSRSS